MTLEEAQDTDFCIMPFIHFYAGNDGKVRLCCEARGFLGQINSHSIKELWNNSEYRDTREKLLNGGRLKACTSCYEAEAAGAESLRRESNRRFAHYLPDIGADFLPSPVYWDIRFSNKCNLRCRTCWHGNSSAWYADARKTGALAGARAFIPSINNDEAFFAALESYMGQAEEWFWAGGEPLLMGEHERVLAMLKQSGNTNVHLRYHTSLMVNRQSLDSLITLLQAFKRVTLGISIDHTGAKGEYIRKGSNWETVRNNLDRLRQMLPNAAFEWVPTISIFNAPDFPELYREFLQAGIFHPGELRANILQFPRYYNIRVLPMNLKIDLEKRIRNSVLQDESVCLADKQVFHSVLNYMQSASWTSKIPQFLKTTQKLDAIRRENFLNVFPELGEQIAATAI